MGEAENGNTAKRKVKAPAVRPSHLANAEIDRRLAEAIKERTKHHATIAKLRYAQEQLSLVEQEINSLVQLQQRLNGKEVVGRMLDMGTIPFSHTATVPGGEIGSVPTRQPSPTTTNAGPSVARETGFS